MSYAIPSHLTGEMKALWEEVFLQTNGDPEAEVEVKDPQKVTLLRSLANIGGCTVTDIEGGVKVKLNFETNSVEEVMPEPAVAKPHKFANEE